MLAGIREQKYIYIKDFLSKEELSILQPYCLDKVANASINDFDTQSLTAPSYYNDPIINIVLRNKIKKAEEISKLSLYTTYAYWRGYTYGSILEDHLDRPSCEISITANIDSCGISWPIHMEHTDIEIKTGDAVMYLGCELLHGRKNSFTGRYMAQAFFHYVDQKGGFKHHKGDQIVKMFGK